MAWHESRKGVFDVHIAQVTNIIYKMWIHKIRGVTYMASLL